MFALPKMGYARIHQNIALAKREALVNNGGWVPKTQTKVKRSWAICSSMCCENQVIALIIYCVNNPVVKP